MKKYFKIIMQLHAEEGGAPAPAATTEPAPAVVPATEPAPVTTQEPAPAAQQPSSTEPAATPSPDYKVVAEEGGLQVVVGADGRRHLIDKSLEPEPKQNTEVEPAPVPGTGTEPQSQQAKPASEVESAPVPATTPVAQAPLPAYTPEEMSLAIQMGIVDESRIPPAFAVQYGQFKEKQAQQQAVTQAQQQTTQPTQQNEIQQRIAYMKEIDKVAREETLKQLGLTEDDLKDAEYANYADNPDLEERVKSFEGMLAYNRQQIINNVQAQMAKDQQQAAARKAVNDSIISFALNEQRTEPHFKEINESLETFYQSLPYSKGDKYAKALNSYKAGTATEEQAKVLHEYYEEAKKAFYAKANNLSTTPKPVVRRPASVESPGTGQDIPKPAANPKELRDLDYMGRIAWIRDNI